MLSKTLLATVFFFLPLSDIFAEQNSDRSLGSLTVERKSALSEFGGQLGELLNQQENLAEVEKNKEKDLREIEDLMAQKEMAKWAWPMFILTLINVITSVFGIIGLVMTIRNNTKALEISADGLKLSKKTSQAQLRPYIQAILSNSFKTILTDGAQASIAVKFNNVGHTPAINLKHSMNVGICSHEDAKIYVSKLDLGEFSPKIIFPQGGEADVRFLNAENSSWMRNYMNGVRLKKLRIIVDSMATYDDEFGVSHCTSARWEIFLPHDGVIIAELSKEGNFAS